MTALTPARRVAMRAGRDRYLAAQAAAAASALDGRGRAGDAEAAAALRKHGRVTLAAQALGVSRAALHKRVASASASPAKARRVSVLARAPVALLAELERTLQIAADGGDPGRGLLAAIARDLGIVPRAILAPRVGQ